MQFSVKTGSPNAVKTQCAILPLFERAPVAGVTKIFDRACRGRIRAAVRSGDASTDAGRCLLLRDVAGSGASNLLLVGCGSKSRFSGKELGKALTSAALALSESSIANAVSFLAYELPGKLDAYYSGRTTVQALSAAIYRFTELKSKPDKGPKLARFGLAAADDDAARETRRGVGDGRAIANGVALARDLGNRPPNVCTPSHLADVAKNLAKKHESLKVKVLNEADMKRMGMGALLAVTQGAAEPARLIVIEHRGAPASVKPVVLCGKGVTFDTGGISLKPPPKMDEMKFDMCGAASVIGAMASVAELGLDTNVVALVPACENMPGDRATRPGDIVTSMSGQTIEILNTDAEGRLILSDALTYAHEFKPRCIVDVATLTGACVVALGPLYTGLFSRDENLSADLLAAGNRALDEAWPLPLDDEYGESLRSNFADFANSGAREGGASIAAQFLSRFIDGVPWAHLDIAGVAWRQNQAKGATGRPVALIVDYLLNAE